MREILSAMNKIRGVARTVMLSGVTAAILLLCVALVLLYDAEVTMEKVTLSQNMCTTAVTLFAEGVVLGLLGDAFMRRYVGKD